MVFPAMLDASAAATSSAVVEEPKDGLEVIDAAMVVLLTSAMVRQPLRRVLCYILPDLRLQTSTARSTSREYVDDLPSCPDSSFRRALSPDRKGFVQTAPDPDDAAARG